MRTVGTPAGMALVGVFLCPTQGANLKENAMSVRAKFTCNSKIPSHGTTTVYFNAVYANKDGSRAEENKAFSDATPSGQIALSIADGKPALDAFELGKSYFVDFTPA
ncbi:hypothetical protein [Simplicispira sedimenti]|uniref:hypothetical protein n=1 Tax=Simplicispira sedimenti TaxID=2919500 RepID=UPI001FAA9BDD|nr:hypothetical protein [Acidovorax sp. W1-6]